MGSRLAYKSTEVGRRILIAIDPVVDDEFAIGIAHNHSAEHVHAMISNRESQHSLMKMIIELAYQHALSVASCSPNEDRLEHSSQDR